MAILGIDEVGRGPWAGPLVVGAAILPQNRPSWVADLRDSKQLSADQRETLNAHLLREAATGLGWVWQYEIDEIGISPALKLATRRALHDLKVRFRTARFSEIIIDGTQNFLAGTALASRATTLVKGDDLVKEISAASIVAKVTRDRYMIQLAQRYPQYHFENHKGYGTAQHRAALQTYGVTPEHRLSLKPIRKLLGLPPLKSRATSRQNTTKIGQQAETKVANFLTDNGHQIIARNYKNQLCEIDIITTKHRKIYFSEVKYRQNSTRGDGLEAITPTKKRQMTFAAQIFLLNHPEFKAFDPLLAVASVAGDNFQILDYLVLSE